MKWFRKNENGSITLEAAMVLPLFLAFVILLIAIIRLTITQMALQNATTEMTKQAATHIYPISYAFNAFQGSPLGEAVQQVYELATDSDARVDKAGEFIDSKIDGLVTDPIVNGLQKQLEQQGLDPMISQVMTDFVKDHILSAATNELKEEVKKEAIPPIKEASESLEEYTKRVEQQMKDRVNSAVNNAVRPFVMSFVDERLIDKKNLNITKLTLPNLTDKHPKFGVNVEYTVRLIVPFISYDFKIRSKAVERVWSGMS
ncbi:TadE/TadG family type IV pilus assembly protein [Paenibacillus alvei]|uniref:TadE/TadG family type IV pilus assembly protein n=1 Tax=Paenibacillus TaxID=44249 RepID=UPI002281C44F|nr:TadE family protein [Paenibacillus alvei]